MTCGGAEPARSRARHDVLVAEVTDDSRCPCLSGETYGACCGRFHAGLAAGGPYPPTAAALMRSRYSASAVGDLSYLKATWHPRTRPADLAPDGVTWRRLDVLGTVAGGPFDTAGVVEFVAHYRFPAGAGRLHEVSRFVREGRRWF